MSIDLSALSSAQLTAQALSNLVLVNPQKNIGIQAMLPSGSSESEPESFLFDFEGENSVTLDMDITDHFVEDNTALQDHVAIKPVMIETEGFVGELSDIAPRDLLPLKKLADKLTTLQPFLPQLSATALIAYNDALQAYQTAQAAASAAVQAWSQVPLIGSTPNLPGFIQSRLPVQNKQQAAYDRFYAYAQNRQLFRVQTPWAVFENMEIKTLRAVQDPNTRTMSTFNVTFKQMRFTSTLTNGSATALGRAVDQSASIEDRGLSIPIPGPSLNTQLNTSGLA